MTARIILWGIAAFYAYGALVHVANITGLSGFNWLRAPLKWQLLDIVYLVLDIAVVLGILLEKRFGIVAFFIAAASQIVLYARFRSWVVDVPEEFLPTEEQIAYLDLLIGFHILTIVLMLVALRLRRT